MKQLIVGIDGGTSRIFDAFNMPFWKSLRDSGVTFPVVEDLNQRGWARMLAGMGAEETGALYMRPKLDGTRDFTISYGYKDLAKTPNFIPIWKLAEESGAKVGMMNVPTTAPAQPVDGFYISGGGGGVMQGGLPPNAVYPESFVDDLNSQNYIFDTRLGAQSFSSPDELCDRLSKMMIARSRAFSALAKKSQIDFGFVAFRAPTVMLYLAMSEIAHIMRHPVGHMSRSSWSSLWLPLIVDHMKVLDECLERLFNELLPENYIICSDHSIVPWTHNVDFNGFLAEAGFAEFVSSPKLLLKNFAKAILKDKARYQIKQAPASSVFSVLKSMNAPLKGGMRAFSRPYVYGIYVNDEKRFNGPVKEEDIISEVDRIANEFNWRAENSQLNMIAQPYRAKFYNASMQACLPDITIIQSGHAFPSNLGANWYTKNAKYGPVKNIVGVGGMHSGQKGTNPILLTNKELASLGAADDVHDLRSVHKFTAHIFKG